MKKILVGLVFGGGLVYLTLSFQPSFLVTIGTVASDSTSVKTDTIIPVPEIPAPAVITNDTIKADTTIK